MKKGWILALAMLATVIGREVLHPRPVSGTDASVVELETLIPQQFEQWHMDQWAMLVRPDAEVAQQLGKLYAGTLERTYIDGNGYRIMLSIAYGSQQTHNLRAHLPELCYVAQGFQVDGLIQERIHLGIGYGAMPVTRMMTKNSLRLEPVTYWLNLSGKVVNNKVQRKLASLAFGMKGDVPEGMLVRVSSIDADMIRAYERQDRFLREWMAVLDDDKRRQIFGNSSLASMGGG